MHTRNDSGVAFAAEDGTDVLPQVNVNDLGVETFVKERAVLQGVADQSSILTTSEPLYSHETLSRKINGIESSVIPENIDSLESDKARVALDIQSVKFADGRTPSLPLANDSSDNISGQASIPLSHTKGPDLPNDIPATWDLLVASITNYPNNLAVASIQQKGEFYGLSNLDNDHPAYKASPYLRWSYVEFAKGLTRCIDALKRLGVEEGSPVFTFINNAAEVPLIVWAVAALGASLIPISPQVLLNTEETSYALGRGFLVCSNRKSVIFTQDTEGVDKLSSLGLFNNPTYISMTSDRTDPSITSFKSFIESGEEKSLSFLSQYGHSAARRKVVIFTSGTTSLPKAVLFDAYKADRWVLKHSGICHTDQNDSVLINLPNNHAFYHMYGSVYACRSGGIVIGGPSFAADLYPTIMEIERITHIAAPPTLAQAMLQVAESQGLRFPYIKSILLGSAKVTGPVLQRIIDGLGVQGAIIMYGSTEVGCIVTTGVFSDANSIVRNGDPSVGWADMGTEIKICAPGSREPLPLNTEGEVYCSTSMLYTSYIGEPEHEAFFTDEHGQRWYATGDAAIMTEEGLIFVVGRVKDMIIRGGKNISPAAIEAVLGRESKTKIFNIQVVGQIDEIAGEIPIAVSKISVTADDIRDIQDAILQNMGPIYLVEEVLTLEELGLDDFPRANLDKISKSQLTKIVREYLDKKNKPQANGTHQTDELTQQVQKVWKRTIGHTVDSNKQITDFADSITIMRVRDRLSKEVGVKLTLAELIEAKTIQDQITMLRSRSKESVHQEVVAKSVEILDERDLLYMTGNLATAQSARKHITNEISNFGLGWEDVYSVNPASDFVQTFVQADICNTSWSWKIAFVLKSGSSKMALRHGIETMLTTNNILPSFLFWNRKAFGSDLAIHVIPKSNEKLFDAVFKDYGSVANVAELANLIHKPYEYEMALVTGLLCHFLLFHIEETNQVGAVWVSHHATMDATYMQLIFDDLDKALGGITPRPHVPYKIWADSYYSLRTSFEAQLAVKWQVDRLLDINECAASVFPPLPRPHHFSSSQLHIQSMDDNGYHANFHAAGLTNLRQKHPQLSAPVIIKTAWTFLNMHRTGTNTALFTNLQNDRERFPFIPKILEALSPAHTFEADDVAGMILEDVINIIPLDPEETVLDLFYRMKADQKGLTEFAAAPLKSIMQQLGPLNSEIMLDVFRSQIFNWTPGLGAMKTVNPHENYQMLGTFIRPSIRLVINVDVAGADDETVYFELKSPLYDRDGLEGLAEDFEDFVHFVCDESNWNRKSAKFKNALRQATAINGDEGITNGHG